jgi:hypothetical protein
MKRGVKKSLTTTGYQFDTSLLQGTVLFSSLEDNDMKITLKTLLLSSAALCATAAFAADHAKVDVPFSFTAKGQSFPAGSYDVAMDANHSIVTLSSKSDTTKEISWTVRPAEAAKTPAVIRFDQVGTDYALKTIQLGERVTPNLDRSGKRGVSATTSIGGE